MTDSSKDGPNHGGPEIMPARMLGDRVAAIFSSPKEIGRFIESKCWPVEADGETKAQPVPPT